MAADRWCCNSCCVAGFRCYTCPDTCIKAPVCLDFDAWCGAHPAPEAGPAGPTKQWRNSLIQVITLLSGILTAVATALQGAGSSAKAAALVLTAIATCSTLLAAAIKGDEAPTPAAEVKADAAPSVPPPAVTVTLTTETEAPARQVQQQSYRPIAGFL